MAWSVRAIQPGLPRRAVGWLVRRGWLSVVPPAERRTMVGSQRNDAEFLDVGRKWVRDLVDVAGLRPDAAVLDVGCGCGRMAIHLTGYLSTRGRYCGFDVDGAAVRWCRDRITPGWPNFEFIAIDVYNGAYNAGGKTAPAEFRFPYSPATFDMVNLASVFTHMLPADVDHYLDEIARVLRPGGKCFASFFLLNEASRAAGATGKPTLNFLPGDGETRVLDAARPEAAIAYEEAVVRRMFAAHGLRIQEPIRYGGWSGRTDVPGGQDGILAVRA